MIVADNRPLSGNSSNSESNNNNGIASSSNNNNMLTEKESLHRMVVVDESHLHPNTIKGEGSTSTSTMNGKDGVHHNIENGSPEGLPSFSDHSFPEPEFCQPGGGGGDGGGGGGGGTATTEEEEEEEEENDKEEEDEEEEESTLPKQAESQQTQNDENGEEAESPSKEEPESSQEALQNKEEEEDTEEGEEEEEDDIQNSQRSTAEVTEEEIVFEPTDHEEQYDDFDDLAGGGDKSNESAAAAAAADLKYKDEESITLSMQSKDTPPVARYAATTRQTHTSKGDGMSVATEEQSFNPWATNSVARTNKDAGNNNDNNNLDSSNHTAATKPRMVSFYKDTSASTRSVGFSVPSGGGGGGGGGGGICDDDRSVRSQTSVRTFATTTTNNMALLSRPRVETHMAVRVLKGEIHNVLTVMRSAEHSLYMSAQRFTEELTEESHPLVQQFQDLHFTLSDWDLQMAAQALYRRQRSVATATSNELGNVMMDPELMMNHKTPDSLMYLPPFCVAVTTREINAPVTGACLTALHKFLLYGFVHPARDAQAGMTLIAKALLHCTFEETTATTNANQAAAAAAAASAAKQRHLAWRKQMQQQQQARANNPNHTSSNASVSSTGNDSDGQATVNTHNNKKKSKDASEQPPPEPESHAYYHPTQVNDEQVVLKLLDLAALVVRCSFLGAAAMMAQMEQNEHVSSHQLSPMAMATGCLIEADLVVGLLDTCLHVSHVAQSASPLLKSAASDALGQIVLQVFSHQPQPLVPIPSVVGGGGGGGSSSSSSGGGASRQSAAVHVSPRPQVLAKLTSLLNPDHHDEQVIVCSLTAVNIALETATNHHQSMSVVEGGNSDTMSPAEIAILQNDLFKYLLQWSTTSDLHILSLTLRVIFNLFQSIPNHLKVPLEVFLTSVHLRILDSGTKHKGTAHYAASLASSSRLLKSTATSSGPVLSPVAAAATSLMQSGIDRKSVV